MEPNPLRGLLGGALTAAILAGCSSRSPFTVGDGTLASVNDARAARPRPTSDLAATEDQVDLPVLGPSATLDGYLRYAALSNAGLEASFQDWKAAVERVPQIGALPDPRFTYGYYLGEVETRVGPMQHSLALSQTFPWLGKLRDREDAAARDADAAWRRFEAARLELFLRVEQAYNELFFLERSIDVTNDNVELLQQLERVARMRYRVAAAGHPDIIKVQVELGTMENRRRQLRDLRAPYAARLNAALNRPAGAVVPPPGAISDRVIDTGDDELRAVLRERNPELIALQEEIERERIGAEIARKDGRPDFTVGLAYTVIDERNGVDISENGDDAVLATVSVNLPIWRDKYDAGVREAVARRLATASRHSETANRLASELEEALFEHRDARRRVGLYRDTLVPKATESLQASLGSFEQGEIDFLDLIETERTLLEFQLALERALVDRATSCARIERLVGASLSDGNVPPAVAEDAR
jgi:outer membrane protein TolC